MGIALVFSYVMCDHQITFTNYRHRNKNARADSVCCISMLHCRAGGVGLNLVGANHCFMLDLPYNPAVFDQATDRMYVYYNLM